MNRGILRIEICDDPKNGNNGEEIKDIIHADKILPTNTPILVDATAEISKCMSIFSQIQLQIKKNQKDVINLENLLFNEKVQSKHQHKLS